MSDVLMQSQVLLTPLIYSSTSVAGTWEQPARCLEEEEEVYTLNVMFC